MKVSIEPVREHIAWTMKHLPLPPTRNAQGKEVERVTDVFAHREGRWRAVNAQENRAEGSVKR